MKHIPTFEEFIIESVTKEVEVKDFFKNQMHAADVRGWLKNTKLTDTEKKDKIKAVMDNPAKFNDLMDAFSNELKIFK